MFSLADTYAHIISSLGPRPTRFVHSRARGCATVVCGVVCRCRVALVARPPVWCSVSVQQIADYTFFFFFFAAASAPAEK